ncbi:hypothetical protein DSECCO2_644920 [anaerobic digester metagenome]
MITSILGNDSAGPDNSRARAGPLPMPLPKSPCNIGTSVSVAKYIKAPEMEANRFAHSEFPPTAISIQRVGIQASLPGRPNSAPAIITPRNSKGMINLAKLQVDPSQSLSSPFSSAKKKLNSAIAVTNGIRGCNGKIKPAITTETVMANTFHILKS